MPSLCRSAFFGEPRAGQLDSLASHEKPSVILNELEFLAIGFNRHLHSFFKFCLQIEIPPNKSLCLIARNFRRTVQQRSGGLRAGRRHHLELCGQLRVARVLFPLNDVSREPSHGMLQVADVEIK